MTIYSQDIYFWTMLGSIAEFSPASVFQDILLQSKLFLVFSIFKTILQKEKNCKGLQNMTIVSNFKDFANTEMVTNTGKHNYVLSIYNFSKEVIF